MDIDGARGYMMERLSRELSPTLYYHGLHHTHDVVHAAMKLADLEQLTNRSERVLLETAAWYHDSGFLVTYRGHEEAGCDIVRQVLPTFGYQFRDIDEICSMIMATKVPQTPSRQLERILCDADLDYLGRDDFEPIAATLFKELKVRDLVSDHSAWNALQIGFLEEHRYWTASAIMIREPGKAAHLKKLQ